MFSSKPMMFTTSPHHPKKNLARIDPSKIEWDLTNGPRSVSCKKAIRYSGLFGVFSGTVLLEISWKWGKFLAFHQNLNMRFFSDEFTPNDLGKRSLVFIRPSIFPGMTDKFFRNVGGPSEMSVSVSTSSEFKWEKIDGWGGWGEIAV